MRKLMDRVQAVVSQHPHTSSSRIAGTKIFFQLVVQILSKHSCVNYAPLCTYECRKIRVSGADKKCIINLIPHLQHIRARASPHHLHECSYSSVSVRMNCFHIRMNIHMFVQINANEPFSPFVPFDSCWKTASRASAKNGEANDATNDEANMWLVRSLFASLFTSSFARMCKYSVMVYFKKTTSTLLPICE